MSDHSRDKSYAGYLGGIKKKKILTHSLGRPQRLSTQNITYRGQISLEKTAKGQNKTLINGFKQYT